MKILLLMLLLISVFSSNGLRLKYFGQPRNRQTRGNYCNVNSNHVMCLYSGPSNQCYPILSGLTSTEEQHILDTHNNLRSKVAQGNQAGQPSATNMRKLVYNSELAEIAQRWADQCTFAHDQNRDKLDGTYAGQNLWIKWSSREASSQGVQQMLEDGVMSWYNEVDDPGFNSAHINPFQFNSGIGHYTQIVWADTQELGCGFNHYEEEGWFTSLLVCNYAQGGNYGNAAMYLTGVPASNCPTGTTPTVDGLCQNI